MRKTCLRTGPFSFEVRSDLPWLLDAVDQLYETKSSKESPDFVDFHIEVMSSRGVRRWIKPQAIFSFDGETQIKPLPQAHALPLLEWGMNWVIATQANQFLIFHAAAIERGGRAVVMPAEPGSGKSTLTAALVNRGWRLLSDELALVCPGDRKLVALARPISLKNQSIDVIARFVPEAAMSVPVRDTTKGTVALLKPPRDSVLRVAERAEPRWIIFPRYLAGSDTRLERRPKAGSLMYMAENALNYSVYGASGFEMLADIIDACDCLEFTYSDLREAVDVFDTLSTSA